MKKKLLTLGHLKEEASRFCEQMSSINHPDLIGVTDGKAVGTYVEHLFKNHLLEHYEVVIGNSAKGIDLPGSNIQTDIKVTSISQPQSSCPFRDAKQKIFGLGYNLLVFVYAKHDTKKSCHLKFTHCVFISKEHTADYTITKRLREMLDDGANKEDIIAYLSDRGIPGDQITYNEIADELLTANLSQGYLTISNALQWRLQYSRVIALNNTVKGIINHEWQA